MKIAKLSSIFAVLLLSLSAYAGEIDINAASAEELTTLSGVGPVLAERIVKEREEGGDFVNPEDLAERVPGVGSTFLENNAERFSAEAAD